MSTKKDHGIISDRTNLALVFMQFFMAGGFSTERVYLERRATKKPFNRVKARRLGKLQRQARKAQRGAK